MGGGGGEVTATHCFANNESSCHMLECFVLFVKLAS